MTDAGLHRVDQILSELVETVETARAVPMSTSCVVPRERMLDLFDDLREVLPVEMIEARKLVTQRDTVVRDAESDAEHTRTTSSEAADAIIADARHQAEDLRVRAEDHARELIEAAEAGVREIVEAGRAEHAHLVSATGTYQAAAEEAARLRGEAEYYDQQMRSQADEYAAGVAAEAERYAARLRVDSDAYAHRSLSDLLDVIQRAGHVTEQGLSTLAARQPAPQQSSPPEQTA